MIATWEDVRAYKKNPPQCPVMPPENSPGNTFQAIIASNGIETFAMFNYQEIQWLNGSVAGSTPAQVGFDSGDERNFYATPKSRTPAIIDIVTDSNVGVPGKMIFKLGEAGSNITGIVLPAASVTSEQPTAPLNIMSSPTTSNLSTVTPRRLHLTTSLNGQPVTTPGHLLSSIKRQTTTKIQLNSKTQQTMIGKTILNQQTTWNEETTLKAQTLSDSQTTLIGKISSSGQTTLNEKTPLHEQTVLNRQTTISGPKPSSGQTILNGQQTLNEKTTLNQKTSLNGQTTVNGQKTFKGQITMSKKTLSNKQTTLNRKTTVDGQTTLNGQTTVDGQTTLNGQTTVHKHEEKQSFKLLIMLQMLSESFQ
ncbi:TECTA [Bugula neritina]|uniref:TECTA n=1 Tax=Bugula neritina TaxID=10212 RepID=A0A7J7J4A1_BUGNE|nr:TECTA [Bugula neritina]